ncbi:MAG: sulfite oxidase-like oxidoreductase [Anaerolineales bacterium]|nr:sulfite oxidase-like oxidoreductase [Anaerolineales bacterium]MCZ2120990.1 sulfite oxidase-like oxidoreductase [Anaerolineales bacterium]
MFQFDGQDRRRQEDQMRAEGRLPPGQALTQKFPVLHYGPVPAFNPATWDFRVWGEVEEEKRWDWNEFNQLPRTKIEMDIHCVTRWSKFNTVWEGVSVKALIENGFFKIKSTATHVMQHAEYGFTVNLPLEVVLQDTFLLATHLNGEALTPEHGYPLRGVVGFMAGREDLETPYFWKGAKWVRALEFMSQDKRGFWEQAGYHNRGDVWREERFG